MGQHHLAVGILQLNGTALAGLGGEGGIGLTAALNAVKHITAGNHGTTVDVNTLIRVDTRIRAKTAGLRQHRTAVDHQPAVGIDAIALTGGSVDHDGKSTAVDGGHRHVIFVGVDAIVARLDVDDAAVDGEMEFAVQALIFGFDGQFAVAISLVAALNPHRHLGIERRIVLVQLLGVCHSSTILSEFHRTGLVDARHVGAIDFIFAVIGEDHPRTCGGQIHVLGGGFLVGGATFVDVIENDGRCHLTSDVHPIQHQGHHRFGILFGIVP